VLRLFSDKLKEICREYDYVAAWAVTSLIIAPGLKQPLSRRR